MTTKPYAHASSCGMEESAGKCSCAVGALAAMTRERDEALEYAERCKDRLNAYLRGIMEERAALTARIVELETALADRRDGFCDESGVCGSLRPCARHAAPMLEAK